MMVGLTTGLLLPLSFPSSSSSSLMISRPSDVTLKPCSTLALFFSPGLVAEKQQKHLNRYLHRRLTKMQTHSNYQKQSVLPSTLWETLGSRKLSGSSSAPSLSQARAFCGFPAFFWALRAFPSSSDKSLSDSARMSSILERRGVELYNRKRVTAWGKSGLCVGEQWSTFGSLF